MKLTLIALAFLSVAVLPSLNAQTANLATSTSSATAITPNTNHGSITSAAEIIPPAPKEYFNDFAHVVSTATTTELNGQLEKFERDTSCQIVVAVYPKMQSDSSIRDYTLRVAQSWGVGQKGKNNGVAFFVFVQNRTVYIQVGHGLERALPDALAKRIIDNEISPYFHKGDFDTGFRAGVTAILQATKSAYQGTGRTVAEPLPQRL